VRLHALRVEYKKLVAYRLGLCVRTRIWMSTPSATHARDAGFLVSDLSRKIDSFLAARLRANEEAGGSLDRLETHRPVPWVPEWRRAVRASLCLTGDMLEFIAGQATAALFGVVGAWLYHHVFFWYLRLSTPSARRVGIAIGIQRQDYDLLPEPKKRNRLWLIVNEDPPYDPTCWGRIERILFPGF